MTPQVTDYHLEYEVTHDKIIIHFNEFSDEFDFTDMPDGELQLWDKESREIIYTEDYDFPILSAEKKNGELWVEFIFSIDIEEDDERLLFPDWMTLDDFNELMDELVEREDREVINEESEDIDIEEVDF